MELLTPKAVIFDLGSTLIEYPGTVWEEVFSEGVEAGRRYLLKDVENVPGETQFLVKEMVKHAQFLHVRRIGRQPLRQARRQVIHFKLRGAEVQLRITILRNRQCGFEQRDGFILLDQ